MYLTTMSNTQLLGYLVICENCVHIHHFKAFVMDDHAVKHELKLKEAPKLQLIILKRQISKINYS
jgi:hypothetical protein